MALLFLNALIPPENGHGTIICTPSTVEAAMEAAQEKHLSFIGHESTAQLFGVEHYRRVARPRVGDTAYVLRLARRNDGDRDRYSVTLEDFDVLFVRYLE